MLRRAIWALVVVVCLAVPVAVHAQGDYLDVYIVKVKPEKLADFQALTTKWIDANRRFNGDRWIAMETLYGDGNVFQFTSTRQDYAEIDKENEAAMSAAIKAFGKEVADKMERDFQNCLVWSRSELRRRRWDLSRKSPADFAAYAKFIGESRVLRTTAVHVRPGRTADFEALLKEAKEGGLQEVPAGERRVRGADRIGSIPVLARTQQSAGSGSHCGGRFLAPEDGHGRRCLEAQSSSRQERRTETNIRKTEAVRTPTMR